MSISNDILEEAMADYSASDLFRVPTNLWQTVLRFGFSRYRWARRVLGGMWVRYLVGPGPVTGWVWLNELPQALKDDQVVVEWEEWK